MVLSLWRSFAGEWFGNKGNLELSHLILIKTTKELLGSEASIERNLHCNTARNQPHCLKTPFLRPKIGSFRTLWYGADTGEVTFTEWLGGLDWLRVISFGQFYLLERKCDAILWEEAMFSLWGCEKEKKKPSQDMCNNKN